MSQDPRSSARTLYAGFWRRFAALTLDCLLLYFIILVAILVLAGTGGAAALPFVLVAIPIFYFAGYQCSPRQATPGKRALGIKVTDLAGHRIGLGRSVARAVVTLASLAVLGLGFVPAAFTSRRMALDDILAGTVVVNAAATTDEVIAGGEVMPLTLGVWLAIMLPVAAAIGAAYVAISAFHDYQRRYTSPRADSGASSVPRPASKLARGSP